MDFKNLLEPFNSDDVEWRIQQSGISGSGKPWGIALCYVTNRAIQQRLDDIIGPQYWKNEYAAAPTGGIMCGLSIKVDNEWITKWDGAENTQVEAVKGGLSGAMKRAAVQWGIGRYLYNLEATFAECFADNKTGKYRATFKPKTGQQIYGSWNPPGLPEWALPPAKLINDDQFHKIITLCNIKGLEIEVINNAMGIEDINCLHYDQFSIVMDRLKQTPDATKGDS